VESATVKMLRIVKQDEVPGEAFDRVVPAEKSELKIEADNILDCTGEFGPTQFSKVKNFLESLEKGQVGMVLISDPGSLPPVKALGLESGYELLKTEEADGLSSIYIKKT
jgi:TusA-related sulfurtransferase